MDTIWEWLLPAALAFSAPTTSSLRLHRVCRDWHRIVMAEATLKNCFCAWITQHESNQKYAIDLFGLHYTKLIKTPSAGLKEALGFSSWKDAAIMCFGTPTGLATVFKNVPFAIPHREFVFLANEILQDYTTQGTFDLEAIAVLQEHAEFFLQRALKMAADDSLDSGVSTQKLKEEMGISFRPWEPDAEEIDDDEYLPDHHMEMDCDSCYGDSDSCSSSHSNSCSSICSDESTSDYWEYHDNDSEHYSDSEEEPSFLRDITQTNGIGETPAHFLAQLHPETLTDWRMDADYEDIPEIENSAILLDQTRYEPNMRGTNPVHLVNRAKSIFGDPYFGPLEKDLCGVVQTFVQLEDQVEACFDNQDSENGKKDPFGEETKKLQRIDWIGYD
ncbi:hypothetical protein BDR26DRAFT_871748 [Obelidium mucronatum]|nr:hypothetical protein BDR26DRAFT_871748 [Obelidium mucronatum]